MRGKIGPPLGIQTLQQIQQANRRLDRFRREVNRTLTAMETGACLHLHYQNGRAIWRLSSGPFITSEVANVVTQNPHVIGVNDGLLPDHHRTWRYCND